MIIAVIGDMNPRQQLVIDKILSDGHEVVYIGKDEPFDGKYNMDFCIVDEYSDMVGSMFDGTPFPTVGAIVQRPEWKTKLRPQKPYYRQKEKW